MFGAQRVLGSRGCRGRSEIDRNPGPSLILGLGQLDNLLTNEAQITLQIELVGAGYDVISIAVNQPIDGSASTGVVDDRLSQFEGVTDQGEVNDTGRTLFSLGLGRFFCHLP